jgi:hypothetical protein
LRKSSQTPHALKGDFPSNIKSTLNIVSQISLLTDRLFQYLFINILIIINKYILKQFTIKSKLCHTEVPFTITVQILISGF